MDMARPCMPCGWADSGRPESVVVEAEARWPIARAARDWMICCASGRSYGRIVAGGWKAGGGFNRNERYAFLAV